jgi:MFS family permease
MGATARVVAAATAIAAAAALSRAATRPADASRHAGRFTLRGLYVLLVVEAALGVALGLVEVAVPATATQWGDTAYSGFLLGAFALGGAAGGLWFGRHDWRSSPERRYLVAVLILALALMPPIAPVSRER